VDEKQLLGEQATNSMNQEKAREFFSSYYEGSLDPGLKQALEQAMGKDASIRTDYKEFELTCEELGSLKFETIEIPFGLNDKILANIDRHVLETKKNQQPGWMMWLRNVAIAGVSCVAILGAALSLRNLSGRTANADVINADSGSKDELSVKPNTNRDATIHFAPSQTDTLLIREGLKGQELRRYTVAQGEELNKSIENPNQESTVFDIETPKSDTRSILIALPGSSPSHSQTGQGNLEDFAKALATRYRVPVEVHVARPTMNVSWNLQEPDALNAARTTLNATRYAITLNMNGLLVISEQ
jgi:hypothetical protein